MEVTSPKFSSSGYISISSSNVADTDNRSEPINNSRDGNNTRYIQSSKRPRRSENGQGRFHDSHVVWKTRDAYSPGIVGLHEEIEDYCDYVSPTENETNIRLKVIEHITKTITSMWPHAKVETFGSFRTGLFLPSSDIDMVVIGNWETLPLYTLGKALEKSGIHESDIVIISRATVPIVKLTHSPTQVRVDISFNMENGISSAKMVKQYKKDYPGLSKLVLVLKQFLKMRNLNEVFNGGMSSYCLTLLVISFLQGPQRAKYSVPPTNLGTLLLEFLELFGHNFNYNKVCICVKDGGSYKRKSAGWSFLSVEDPLQAGNDIAKGSYSMPSIKFAFESAYYTLQRAVNDIRVIRPRSILDLIVHFDNDVLEHRRWVSESFDTIIGSFCTSCEDQSSVEELGPSENESQQSFNSSILTQSLPLSYSAVTNSSQTINVSRTEQLSGAPRCNASGETQKTMNKPFQKPNSKFVHSNGPNDAPVNQGSGHQTPREYRNSQKYNQGNNQTVQSPKDSSQDFDSQEKKSTPNKRFKQKKRNLQQMSGSRLR